MGKKISAVFRGEIVSSIFYIAFGLCLLLIPDATVNIICKIIFGLVMIAAGVYHIGIYAAEKVKATILDLFTGVIVTVLGIYLFFTPQIVIKLLPYLLGAFVLVDSIWKIKGTHRLRKTESELWKVLVIVSLVFLILGAAILVYPFAGVRTMVMFCGGVLVANGAVDLVFLIMLKVILRKEEKQRIAAEKEEENRREAEKKLLESEKKEKREKTKQEKAKQKKKVSLRKKKTDNQPEEPLTEREDIGQREPRGEAQAEKTITGAVKEAMEESREKEKTAAESVDVQKDLTGETDPLPEDPESQKEIIRTAQSAEADVILEEDHRQTECEDQDREEEEHKKADSEGQDCKEEKQKTDEKESSVLNEIRQMLNGSDDEELEEWKD